MFQLIADSIYFRMSRSFDSNIVFLTSNGRQVLIDTGTGMYSDRLDGDLQKIGSSLSAITDIVLTHSHIDHIGGVARLLKEGTPKLHLMKAEAEMINSGDMSLTLASTFGTSLPQMKIDEVIEDKGIIEFGDIQLQAFNTPGHSIGSTCFRVLDSPIMITGDTMFPGGSFGRVDFPTGDPAALVKSLQLLSTMDFEIALPGHNAAIMQGGNHSASISYRTAKNWFRV
jgi:glyoxylase-like metal-dependent hydrolase (beta-lactamase superfamily II)